MDATDKYRNYTQLNFDWFVNVPEFRSFIYNYIRFFEMNHTPFMSWSTPSTWKPRVEKPTAVPSLNFTLRSYKAAQNFFSFTEVKDWYITKLLFDGFQHYGFTDVEEVYNLFNTTCQTPYLKDTIQQYYAAIKRLKPGNPAPGFTLKNEKGQPVSLGDFKGKVVYIDFWGVGCGPCINEMKNHAPAMQKRLEGKDVVFINICVDVVEAEWKEAIKKYKIEGVNLLATGWQKHPVVQAYNVGSIPHYVLIDKQGAIADNNAKQPSLMENENVMKKISIDSLLK
jgi:peroxiredoxin